MCELGGCGNESRAASAQKVCKLIEEVDDCSNNLPETWPSKGSCPACQIFSGSQKGMDGGPGGEGVASGPMTHQFSFLTYSDAPQLTLDIGFCVTQQI